MSQIARANKSYTILFGKKPKVIEMKKPSS